VPCSWPRRATSATAQSPAATSPHCPPPDWISANFIRPETLTAASNRLIAYHQTIALTRCWGSGEVASADGLRFVVPVRSVHAGANPHYFGTGRGVTYYNWSSDQFTSWAAIVIPGTLRDSQFILDGLLDNTSVLQPREVVADTAADSYLVHGLFRLLGYQFSPRLADLPERRYWRLNPRADYGPFNRVATNRIRRQLIEDHWPDICRVAGTLHSRAATASDIIRALQRAGAADGAREGHRRARPNRADDHHAALRLRRGQPAADPRAAQPQGGAAQPGTSRVLRPTG
jgi:TnpA family transposase